MTRSVTTDPVLLAQRQHPVATALLPQALEFSFYVLGNRRTFFDEMRTLLKPNYFTAEESLFAALWEVMCGLADRIAGKFTFETLALALQEHCYARQITLPPQVANVLFAAGPEGILWSMTHVEYGNEHVAYARGLLQRFLQDRTVVSPLRRILSAPDAPANIDEILGTVRDHSARLAGMNEIPRVPVSPIRGAIPYEPPLTYKPTGVSYVDGPLGGQVSGDCGGIIAPTGGGKTTVLVHMAVASARASWEEAVRANTTPEFVAYISVEESGRKLQPRIWSAAYNIPLAKLRTMTSWDQLTTQQNLDAYEHDLARNEPGRPETPVTSESERYDAGQPILDTCFEILDFSGADPYPNAGRGYMPEVASALDQVQQIRRQPLRAVYIDYAGLLVERYLGSNLDDRKLRLWLKKIGDDCRNMVAEKFGCAVWVVHQLRGEAGNSSPLKLMKHTDAGETKDFANNMAVCGCIGVADPATGCRFLNWSKTRNVRNESVTPITLRIHERFAVVEDVTAQFIADDATRRFLVRSEARQIMGAQAAAMAPAQVRPTTGAAATQAILAGPAGMGERPQ